MTKRKILIVNVKRKVHEDVSEIPPNVYILKSTKLYTFHPPHWYAFYRPIELWIHPNVNLCNRQHIFSVVLEYDEVNGEIIVRFNKNVGLLFERTFLFTLTISIFRLVIRTFTSWLCVKSPDATFDASKSVLTLTLCVCLFDGRSKWRNHCSI
jgi:hypothetical protein